MRLAGATGFSVMVMRCLYYRKLFGIAVMEWMVEVFCGNRAHVWVL